ncbi:hypothetical protein [Stenotrophomonas sp. 24(2023)]|uniref:hypothetical protein n=1 Tax=Stenotrophomonas sp. 24(2023) TaxID=3068324 RepID=UPI0027E0E6B4|nr:hypothetical protein [Stenotrophomonas sp. 24(2023)]WMJ69531.1 hypothetical protein Q9R17_00005 [Stenotrophomonas sp. 24(2023)]
MIRLDDEAMVWSEGNAASRMEAIMPVAALMMLGMASGLGYMGVNLALDPTESIWMRVFTSASAGVITAALAAAAFLCIKLSVGSRQSHLYFLRRSRQVFCIVDGKQCLLDWSNVRPYARVGYGPVQFGAPLMMALDLMEIYPEAPESWRLRFTVDGPLPHREACQQSWELIRRYMDDAPEAMPTLSLVDSSHWTTALLERGPLSAGGAGREMIERLRAAHWNVFTVTDYLAAVPLWIAFWPEPVSQMLYARFKRPVAPPTGLLAEGPPRGSCAGYSIQPADAGDPAGRRKAATQVAVVCGLCCLVSITGWILVGYMALKGLQ